MPDFFLFAECVLGKILQNVHDKMAKQPKWAVFAQNHVGFAG